MVEVKPGDKVVMTKDVSGHNFFIGEVVTLVQVIPYEDYYTGRSDRTGVWCFGREEFEPHPSVSMNNQELSYLLEKDY